LLVRPVKCSVLFQRLLLKMSKSITKDMGIQEIVTKHPETAEIFFKFGVHCLGCAAASFETLEQGANAHGIDVDAMVKEMNEVLKKKD